MPDPAGQKIEYAKPSAEVLNRRLLAADRPGSHLWIMTAGWQVRNPQRFGNEVHLDAESIVVFAGPGCYKCEEPFSNRLARQPCRGSLDLMP